MLKLIVAGMLFLVLTPVVPSFGATAQTIVSPGVPRESVYPKVVIYTVSWCPHCRELKQYLTSHNIPFINRDVELDPAAMEQLTGTYKSSGVPVVVIGNEQEILRGFSKEEFEQAVERIRSKTTTN